MYPKGHEFHVFTRRTHDCLKVEGIKTMQQLADLSEIDVLGIPGLGKVSVAEVTRVVGAWLYIQNTKGTEQMEPEVKPVIPEHEQEVLDELPDGSLDMDVMEILKHWRNTDMVPEAAWEDIQKLASTVYLSRNLVRKRMLIANWDKAYIRGVENGWVICENDASIDEYVFNHWDDMMRFMKNALWTPHKDT